MGAQNRINLNITLDNNSTTNYFNTSASSPLPITIYDIQALPYVAHVVDVFLLSTDTMNNSNSFFVFDYAAVNDTIFVPPPMTAPNSKPSSK